MERFSPEILATMTAEQFGDVHGEIIDVRMREDLARRVELAVRDALRAARKEAADLCRERQALWLATEARPATSEPLRAEARARANEAAYLADAIEDQASAGS